MCTYQNNLLKHLNKTQEGKNELHRKVKMIKILYNLKKSKHNKHQHLKLTFPHLIKPRKTEHQAKKLSENQIHTTPPKKPNKVLFPKRPKMLKQKNSQTLNNTIFLRNHQNRRQLLLPSLQDLCKKQT